MIHHASSYTFKHNSNFSQKTFPNTLETGSHGFKEEQEFSRLSIVGEDLFLNLLNDVCECAITMGMHL